MKTHWLTELLSTPANVSLELRPFVLLAIHCGATGPMPSMEFGSFVVEYLVDCING